MAFNDFSNGLSSFNDYISPTVNNTTNLLGDSSLVGVQAEYSYNLKDMICALLAGQGLLLPNLQICLTVALDEILKNPLQGELKDALESLRDSMDSFNEHTGIDNVLKNLNGVISEVAAIGSMINFCADPVNPKSIPNMLEGAFGSFLGKGSDILNAIGAIGPDNMCACVGLDGKFNFSSLNSGALKTISDNLSDILDGSFAAGSLSSLISSINSNVNDLESLISLEGLLNGAYSNGGSSLHGGECSSQLGLPRSQGVGTSFKGGVKDATNVANNLSATFDKLGGYPVAGIAGTGMAGQEFNNIFEVLVEPEMLALLKKGNNYDALIQEKTPIYDYCGNITGYSTTTLHGEATPTSGTTVVSQTAPGAIGSIGETTAASGEESGATTSPSSGTSGSGGTSSSSSTSSTANVIIVSSQAGLEALTVLEGAIAIREDNNVLYVYLNGAWQIVTILPTTWLDNLNTSSGSGILARSGDNPLYRTITGTANEITVSQGDGVAGNPIVGLSDNTRIPGTGGIVIPNGTNAQRTITNNGTLRYNTDTSVLEFRSTDWKTITHSFSDTGTSGAISLIKSDVSGDITLKRLKQGTGASLVDQTDYIEIPTGAPWTLNQSQNSDGQVYTATFTSSSNTGEEVLFDSAQIGPTNDKAWYYDVRFIGRQVGGTLQNAFKVEGVADNTGGTLSIVGTNAKTTYQNSATHWNADIIADTTTNKLKVIVYGETGQSVKWSIFFKLLEA